MRKVIRGGMQAGAWGMSDGLFYQPANHSKTEEVIDLAKIVAEFHGFYTAHVRDDADYNVGAVGAVDEVIKIAREAELPGVVTHIKTMGPRAKGFSAEMIKHIEAARTEGLEIWADQHPILRRRRRSWPTSCLSGRRAAARRRSSSGWPMARSSTASRKT
jgi:N-acyl-D-aspartate/D-glutamate deacylase